MQSEDGERTQQMAAMLGAGLIFVDASGEILWVDDRTRQRVDGGLRQLELPLERSRARVSVDCFLSTIEVEVGGIPQSLCILQERPARDASERDVRTVIAAVEEIMADPSWIRGPFIEKIKAWLQAARPAARVSDLDRLTAREREILVLVCEGQTDAEIGRALDLSQNTVRNHLASVFRKIGVNRRSAAVVWARERAITRHDILEFSRPRRTRSQLVR